MAGNRRIPVKSALC